MVGVFVLEESLFSNNSTPQQGGRPAGPLIPFITMEWALGGTQDTQESRQLNPTEWRPSGPSLTSLTSFFLSNPSAFGTGDVQVMDCADRGAWGSFPGLG